MKCLHRVSTDKIYFHEIILLLQFNFYSDLKTEWRAGTGVIIDQ